MRLPTFKSLQCFEATVRLGTTTQASKELHVTHSAISQNIKLLEEHLGHRLFLRESRTLVPTDNAVQYFQDISGAFDAIHSATHALKLREQPDNVRVKMVSSLAMRWFIPLLPDLNARYPTLNIQLTIEPSSDTSVMPDDIDAGIGICTSGELDQLHSLHLHNSELVLVRQSSTATQSLESVENMPAIYVESPKRALDWSLWSAANDRPEPRTNNRMLLPNSAQALEAVSAGVGVLVTQKIFVAQLIALRQLTTLGRSHRIENEGYYFYCKSDRVDRPALQSFQDWLLKAC